jgi:hypothetical protein
MTDQKIHPTFENVSSIKMYSLATINNELRSCRDKLLQEKKERLSQQEKCIGANEYLCHANEFSTTDKELAEYHNAYLVTKWWLDKRQTEIQLDPRLDMKKQILEKAGPLLINNASKRSQAKTFS